MGLKLIYRNDEVLNYSGATAIHVTEISKKHASERLKAINDAWIILGIAAPLSAIDATAKGLLWRTRSGQECVAGRY